MRDERRGFVPQGRELPGWQSGLAGWYCFQVIKNSTKTIENEVTLLVTNIDQHRHDMSPNSSEWMRYGPTLSRCEPDCTQMEDLFKKVDYEFSQMLPEWIKFEHYARTSTH